MSRRALPLLALVVAAACEPTPVYLIEPDWVEKGVVHDADITADETWRAEDNPHRVVGRITIAGPDAPTVTLEPGVRVEFARNAELRVSTRDEPGALVAGGQPDRPIEFIAGTGFRSPGYWYGLKFERRSAGSRLEHVGLQDCGGGEGDLWPHTCLEIRGGSEGTPRLLVRDLQIYYSAGYGAVVWNGGGFADGSSGLSIVDVHEFAVRIDPNEAGTLPPGTRIEDERTAFVQIAEGRVTESQTWPHLGVPYIVSFDVDIAGEAAPVLEIESGTRLLFGSQAVLRVGGESEPGALVADGSGSRIVFTGLESEPRYWKGLMFMPAATRETRLRNILVQYGGYPNGISIANLTFRVDLGPVLRESVIRRAYGCGVARMPLESGAPWQTDFTDPALGNEFEDNDRGSQCTPGS